VAVADSPGIGPILLLNNTNFESVTEYSKRTSHRFWKAILSMPITVVFGTFTFLCAWSLLSLFYFNAKIVTVAQTTNERVRDVYRYGSTVNTADRGCCRNWHRFLRTPYPSSRLPRDFAQVIIVCHSCNDPASADHVAETVWSGDTRMAM
jgi:hypothetical protein